MASLHSCRINLQSDRICIANFIFDVTHFSFHGFVADSFVEMPAALHMLPSPHPSASINRVSKTKYHDSARSHRHLGSSLICGASSAVNQQHKDVSAVLFSEDTVKERTQQMGRSEQKQ